MPKYAKKRVHAKSNSGLDYRNENHNYTEFRENMIPIHGSNKGRFTDASEEFEIHRASKIYKELLLNNRYRLNPIHPIVWYNLIV